MFIHETKVRVRYAETDQMGYVYYGNYATFYEVARVEMLRSLGTSYKAMEEQGIMMPVTEMKTKYLHPVFYDEQIRIRVYIEELPGVKIRFNYEIYNEKDVLANIGETTLVFVNKAKGRPCKAPENFLRSLEKFFT